MYIIVSLVVLFFKIFEVDDFIICFFRVFVFLFFENVDYIFFELVICNMIKFLDYIIIEFF